MCHVRQNFAAGSARGTRVAENTKDESDDPILPDVSRREVVASGLALSTCALTGASMMLAPEAVASKLGTMVSVSFRVNGKRHEVEIDPRTSLLDLLREQLALTGAKKGCDHGQCGACTVHLNDRRVLSCLTPAVHASGERVTTIEGIADDGELHPMQQAFIDHDALQCGYCTPGQIMSAIACVREGHSGSDEQIREYMSGNLCRCGAYVGILAAISDAAARMKRG